MQPAGVGGQNLGLSQAWAWHVKAGLGAATCDVGAMLLSSKYSPEHANSRCIRFFFFFRRCNNWQPMASVSCCFWQLSPHAASKPGRRLPRCFPNQPSGRLCPFRIANVAATITSAGFPRMAAIGLGVAPSFTHMHIESTRRLAHVTSFVSIHKKKHGHSFAHRKIANPLVACTCTVYRPSALERRWGVIIQPMAVVPPNSSIACVHVLPGYCRNGEQKRHVPGPDGSFDGSLYHLSARVSTIHDHPRTAEKPLAFHFHFHLHPHVLPGAALNGTQPSWSTKTG